MTPKLPLTYRQSTLNPHISAAKPAWNRPKKELLRSAPPTLPLSLLPPALPLPVPCTLHDQRIQGLCRGFKWLELGDTTSRLGVAVSSRMAGLSSGADNAQDLVFQGFAPLCRNNADFGREEQAVFGNTSGCSCLK